MLLRRGVVPIIAHNGKRVCVGQIINLNLKYMTPIEVLKMLQCKINEAKFYNTNYVLQKNDIEMIAEALRIHAVSGRSEQFVCLCPRTEEDNCDRKEPCKECQTCPHFRQTNCH